jgi:hypothetical protein
MVGRQSDGKHRRRRIARIARIIIKITHQPFILNSNVSMIVLLGVSCYSVHPSPTIRPLSSHIVVIVKIHARGQKNEVVLRRCKRASLLKARSEPSTTISRPTIILSTPSQHRCSLNSTQYLSKDSQTIKMPTAKDIAYRLIGTLTLSTPS